MHPLVELAARQHGIVTTAQLLDAGVGRRSIARRVEAGWLVRLHYGVYQVGPVAAPLGREMAAILACEGALSHQSAGAIWGFAHRDAMVHVTVQGQARRARTGVQIHRTASLDAVVHNGLPVTTAARTLHDLRRTLTSHELDRAREQAAVMGLVLEDDERFPEFTRSEGERRLKALCRAAGLPLPQMNARVAGIWPAHNSSSRSTATSTTAPAAGSRTTAARDAALQAAGYRVVRITRTRLTHEPLAVSAQLGALLRLA